MLAQLHEQHGGNALPPAVLEASLGILSVLFLMREVDDERSGIHEEKSNGTIDPSVDKPADQGLTSDGTTGLETIDAPEPVFVDGISAGSTPRSLQRLNQYWTWPIYVPDQNGILAASTTLTVNDAPWIAPNIIHQHRQGKGSTGLLRFVHSRMHMSQAKAFGVRSIISIIFCIIYYDYSLLCEIR